MSAANNQGFEMDMSQGMKTKHKYMLNIAVSFVAWVGGLILTENTSYRDPNYELYEVVMIGGAFYFIATVFLGLTNHVVRPGIKHFILTRKKKKAHQEAKLCNELYEAGFLDEDNYGAKKEELTVHIMRKTL